MLQILIKKIISTKSKNNKTSDMSLFLGQL